MPLEEVLITSAITSTAALFFLTYMYHSAKEEFYKMVWLAMVMLDLIYSFTLLAIGFQTVAAFNFGMNLTLTILQLLIFGLMIVMLLTLYALLKNIMGWMKNLISGRNKYDETK